MSSVYTPGLTVTEGTVITRERRLPLSGHVTVTTGETLHWNSTVARTELPGRVELINVAGKLGLDPAEVEKALLVKVGEPIQKDQPLARNRGFFGFFPATLTSPITGFLESVSGITGQVVLRCPPQPVEVKAYIDGVVEQVIEGEGVIVRSFGALIQGIFGIGGETSGPLRVVVSKPEQEMNPEMLTAEHKGCVLVGGPRVSRPFLERAIELGVGAVLAGGMDDQDLRDFLGYDLGVAITGSEDKGITVILTEGFGPLPISEKTFTILRKLEGQQASVSGATQIRAGVIRPEIIVPRLDAAQGWQQLEIQEESGSLELGTRVRIIREPHFGSFASIVGLPHEPQLIPSEAKVRVAELELPDGTRITLPRANLERIG